MDHLYPFYMEIEHIDTAPTVEVGVPLTVGGIKGLSIKRLDEGVTIELPPAVLNAAADARGRLAAALDRSPVTPIDILTPLPDGAAAS